MGSSARDSDGQRKRPGATVYRCSACDRHWPADGASSSCSGCGKAAQLSCGANPTGRTERDHPCYQPVSAIGERCHFHGRKALRGQAHPNYRHGRHSQHLPARYLEAYAAGLSEEDLVDLRAELALLDARLNEVLSTSISGDGMDDAGWRRLRTIGHQIKSLGESDPEQALDLFVSAILPALDAGAESAAAWSDLRRIVQERAKVVAAHTQAAKALSTAVPLEVLDALVARVALSVRAHVSDRSVVAAIVEELREATVPAGGVN